MMGRTEPLIVDVLVAAFAGVGFHEELAGNFLSAVDLRGTGKEWPIRAVAFAIHAGRWHGRILNTGLILPARLTHITCARAHSGEYYQTNRAADDRTPDSLRQPATFPRPFREDDSHASERQKNVNIEKAPLQSWRAGLDQNQADDCPARKQYPPQTRDQASIPQKTPNRNSQQNSDDDAHNRMQ